MTPATTTTPETKDRMEDGPTLGKRVLGALSPRVIGAVYVWLIIIIVFAILRPETFATGTTVSQVLNSSAISGLAALSLLIPLCTRTFDLSIGFVMSLAGVTAAYFEAKTGVGVAPAVALGLGAAVVIGLINGIVVVILRVDSFIGTLATGSIVSALITLVTNEQDITSVKLAENFAKIGQSGIGQITWPVFYMAIVAIVLFFVLEFTKVGRKLYSVGFNPDAARLAGVSVDWMRFGSLVCSAFLAGVAGVVLASNLGTGSPSAGQSYLLPAFAAAFLGATQLRPGRFNSFGTVLGVLLLTTGITGLQLAAAPAWAADMFTGVVLIAALAITGAERSGLTGRAGPLSRFKARIRKAG